jgi:hypothetical protein
VQVFQNYLVNTKVGSLRKYDVLRRSGDVGVRRRRLCNTGRGNDDRDRVCIPQKRNRKADMTIKVIISPTTLSCITFSVYIL